MISPEPLSQNLTPTQVFKIPKLDNPWMLTVPWMLLQTFFKIIKIVAGSLKDVSPNISDARNALKTTAPNLLAYVVIRLDVAAKAGAGRC